MENKADRSSGTSTLRFEYFRQDSGESGSNDQRVRFEQDGLCVLFVTSTIGCCAIGSEGHFSGHALRMFPAQMAINLERQHSAITVPKPASNGWNINSAFDAARRKKVAQGVVGEASATDNAAGPRQRFLTL